MRTRGTRSAEHDRADPRPRPCTLLAAVVASPRSSKSSSRAALVDSTTRLRTSAPCGALSHDIRSLSRSPVLSALTRLCNGAAGSPRVRCLHREERENVGRRERECVAPVSESCCCALCTRTVVFTVAETCNSDDRDTPDRSPLEFARTRRKVSRRAGQPRSVCENRETEDKQIIPHDRTDRS